LINSIKLFNMTVTLNIKMSYITYKVVLKNLIFHALLV